MIKKVLLIFLLSFAIITNNTIVKAGETPGPGANHGEIFRFCSENIERERNGELDFVEDVLLILHIDTLTQWRTTSQERIRQLQRMIRDEVDEMGNSASQDQIRVFENHVVCFEEIINYLTRAINLYESEDGGTGTADTDDGGAGAGGTGTADTDDGGAGAGGTGTADTDDGGAGGDADRFLEANDRAQDIAREHISNIGGEDRTEHTTFHDVLEDDISNFIPANQNPPTGFISKANIILTVITTVGMVISVLIIAILGIKYMLGSVEEKADYKKDIIPYLIGAVLLFGITSIVKILQAIGGSFN